MISFKSLRKHRKVLVIGLAAGAVLAAGFWRVFGSPENSGKEPLAAITAQSGDSPELSAGRVVYQTYCAQCHGEKGEGQPNWHVRNPDGTYPAPPHDANGHTWHHPDGLLFRTVRDGGMISEVPEFKSAMPAFGDRLGSADIRAVINYIKSFWGDAKTQFGEEKRVLQRDVSIKDPFPAE